MKAFWWRSQHIFVTWNAWNCGLFGINKCSKWTQIKSIFNSWLKRKNETTGERDCIMCIPPKADILNWVRIFTNPLLSIEIYSLGFYFWYLRRMHVSQGNSGFSRNKNTHLSVRVCSDSPSYLHTHLSLSLFIPYGLLDLVFLVWSLLINVIAIGVCLLGVVCVGHNWTNPSHCNPTGLQPQRCWLGVSNHWLPDWKLGKGGRKRENERDRNLI